LLSILIKKKTKGIKEEKRKRHTRAWRRREGDEERREEKEIDIDVFYIYGRRRRRRNKFVSYEIRGFKLFCWGALAIVLPMDN
jgi:hypothetical protein